MALALQGWWGDRQDRAAEIDLLRQMRAELARDAHDVRLSIERSRRMNANAIQILGHFEQGGSYSDTLPSRFAQLGESVPLRAIRRGPYATLESRGLALVTNDSLRMAISDFYEVGAARASLLNEWLFSGEVRWMPELLRRFRYDAMATAATPRNYDALLRDEEFVNLIGDYAFYIGYTVRWKEDIVHQIDTLLAAIEHELVRRGAQTVGE